MENRCTLCTQPLLAIAAVVAAGNIEHPDPLAVCRRCASLPADQRKRLRDQAMTRLLTAEPPTDGPTPRS